MAIGYTVLMEGKKLTDQILLRKFEELGYEYDSFEKLSKGISLSYINELGLIVSLIDSGDYPYNGWDTIFSKKEFIYERIIDFRLEKEYSDLEKRYSVLMKLVFELILELKEKAIFISNGDTELCYFGEESEIYLNNKNGIWDTAYFREIILEKNIKYLE